MAESEREATFLVAFEAALNRNLDEFFAIVGDTSTSFGDRHFDLLTRQNPNHTGWTLLHVSSFRKFTGGVRFLLSKSNFSSQCTQKMLMSLDTKGQTALHVSSLTGNIPICTMIIDQAHSYGAAFLHNLLSVRDSDNKLAADVATGMSKDTLKFLLTPKLVEMPEVDTKKNTTTPGKPQLLVPKPRMLEPIVSASDCVNIGTPLSSPHLPKHDRVSPLKTTAEIDGDKTSPMIRASPKQDEAFQQILNLQTQVMTLVQQLGASQNSHQSDVIETLGPKTQPHPSQTFVVVLVDEAESRSIIMRDFFEDRLLFSQHFSRLVLATALAEGGLTPRRATQMVDATTEPDDELEKSVLFVHGEKHVAGVELHLLVQWRGVKGEEEWMPVGEVQHFAVVQTYLERQQEILEAEMDDIAQASQSLGGHVSPLGETERTQLAQQLAALRAAADSRASADTPLLSRGYSGKNVSPGSPYSARNTGRIQSNYIPMRRMVWSQPKGEMPSSRGMLSSEFQATQIADNDEVLPQPPYRGMTPDQLLKWLENKKNGSGDFLEIGRNSASPTEIESEKLGSRKNSNVTPLVSRSESTTGNPISSIVRKPSFIPSSPPTSRGRVGFTEPPVSSVIFVQKESDSASVDKTNKPQTPASAMQSEYEERLRRIEEKNRMIKSKSNDDPKPPTSVNSQQPNSFLHNLRAEMNNAQEELQQWELAAMEIESRHKVSREEKSLGPEKNQVTPPSQTLPSPRSQTSTESTQYSISQSMAVRETASRVEAILPTLSPNKHKLFDKADRQPTVEPSLPPLGKRTLPNYDHKYGGQQARPFSRPTITAPLD